MYGGQQRKCLKFGQFLSQHVGAWQQVGNAMATPQPGNGLSRLGLFPPVQMSVLKLQYRHLHLELASSVWRRLTGSHDCDHDKQLIYEPESSRQISNNANINVTSEPCCVQINPVKCQPVFYFAGALSLFSCQVVVKHNSRCYYYD